MRRHLPTLAALCALLFLFATCSDSNAADGPGSQSRGSGPTQNHTAGGAATAQSPVRAPLVLDHDFGIVPHGEQRTHEFEVDLSQLGDPFVPLRVHLECSCGRADLRLRKPDGSERLIDGTGYARNMPTEDERAILHIELDTRKKEAVDLPTTASRGYILLQPLDDPTGMSRIRWTFVVRFGIDAPVILQPFAALDFGRVAQSTTAEVMTTVRGDANHVDLQFGEVQTTDPSLQAKLEPGDGHMILRTRCIPGTLGNHRALVTIATNLDGYVLALEAAWKVVPDLEAAPINKVSFSTRLDRAQDKGVETRQFVLVTDHNRNRSPEFVVRSIVDQAGRDVASHFAVTLTPVPSSERQQRMAVRYLGGLDSARGQAEGVSRANNQSPTFRGKILLAKPGDGQPQSDAVTLSIDLVVFPSRQP